MEDFSIDKNGLRRKKKREIRDALQIGIQDYKIEAEIRSEDVRHERALDYHRYKTDLRKLEAFFRKKYS